MAVSFLRFFCFRAGPRYDARITEGRATLIATLNGRRKAPQLGTPILRTLMLAVQQGFFQRRSYSSFFVRRPRMSRGIRKRIATAVVIMPPTTTRASGCWAWAAMPLARAAGPQAQAGGRDDTGASVHVQRGGRGLPNKSKGCRGCWPPALHRRRSASSSDSDADRP